MGQGVQRIGAKGGAAAGEIPTLDELVRRATDLVPYLRKEAAATDRRRSLSPRTMRKLFDAGLLRYFQPRRYGGWEMDWGVQYFISKQLAHGCPSTAWVASVVGQHVCHASRFSREAQEEMWADMGSYDLLVATTSTQKRGSVIRRVPGGFRVSGAFGFSSGIDHSGWGIANGAVEGEGPERWYFLVPRRDYTIGDVWHTIGMKGTGTKDMILQDVFVPDYRAMTFKQFQEPDPPGASWNSGYIYRMELGAHILGTSPLGPIVGAAEAALADYIAITKERVSVLSGQKVTDSEAVHLRVAESAVEVQTADRLVRHDLAILHEKGKAGIALTEGEKLELQRNRGFVAALCRRSVDRLLQMMGAMGIFDENPLNRHFRDVHAMSTQAGVAWDITMPHWSRWALGLPQKINPGSGLMAPATSLSDAQRGPRG